MSDGKTGEGSCLVGYLELICVLGSIFLGRSFFVYSSSHEGSGGKEEGKKEV